MLWLYVLVVAGKGVAGGLNLSVKGNKEEDGWTQRSNDKIKAARVGNRAEMNQRQKEKKKKKSHSRQ